MVKDPVLEHGKEAIQKGYQRKGTGQYTVDTLERAGESPATGASSAPR